MNFVTKNLGWILLLLFFLFMLFVISSNGKEDTNVGTGAINKLVDTEKSQEDLDSLVEMIDEDNDVIISNETAIDDNVKENKKGFFSFMKWGRDEVKEDVMEGNTEVHSEEIVIGSGSEDKKWGVVTQNKQDTDTSSADIVASGSGVITGTGMIKEKKGFFSFLKREKNEVNEELEEVEKQAEDIKPEVKEMTEEKIEEKIEEKVEEKIENKVEEEKQSLFSKIFGKKESNKNESDSVSTLSGADLEVSSSGVIVSDINAEQVVVIPRNELIGAASTESESTIVANVMKKTAKKQNVSYADIRKYAPEILTNSTMYPGINLETKVGRSFEIGVHSLKLNNAYFNTTLAYMMRGDTIKQITEENNYGCFMVEITASQRAYNVGKTGYVCKKYLTDSDIVDEENESEVRITAAENIEVGVSVNTQVGDFITISKSHVILGDTLLELGDVIDQMSNADASGCFIAHVYETQNTLNAGKIGKVCVKNLY